VDKGKKEKRGPKKGARGTSNSWTKRGGSLHGLGEWTRKKLRERPQGERKYQRPKIAATTNFGGTPYTHEIGYLNKGITKKGREGG